MTNFKFEFWPTEYRRINQYFGENPDNYAQFGLPGHEGLDVMAPSGSKIFAVAPGVVDFVRTNPTGHNYGVHVRVNHADNYQTIYAHLQRATVSIGDEVQAGSVLGLADNTGNSFGSHLHLTLKKKGTSQGRWPYNIIDPTPFILPLMGWKKPSGPFTDGWVFTAGIMVNGELAQVSSGGVNLRAEPSISARLIDLVPGGSIIIVTGRKRGQYTPVKVATPSLTSPPPPPKPKPAPPPPVTVTTVDGWGWRAYLTIVNNQAVVGEYGINLRALPDKSAKNIGLVSGGSTVSVIGPSQGEYVPVRVQRVDFSGPVDLPKPPPNVPPIGEPPPDHTFLGWAWTQYLTIDGIRAVVGRFGINLRNAPSRSATNIGLAKGGATVTIVGLNRGEYTPVLARKIDVLNRPARLPNIEEPDPLPPTAMADLEPPLPVHSSTPGWAFTTQISVNGNEAKAGQYGINLRDGPRRTANNIGFVPTDAWMIVTGLPQGEYTPVRVDDRILQPPFSAAPPVIDTTEKPPEPIVDPDPPVLGTARIGLHASADPDISEAEVAEFANLRPGIIKVLSFHNPNGINRLVQAHPDATWVVRTFLDFGGRRISPQQFFDWTISDTKRTLHVLRGKDIVIELHNETNLVPEGLGASWSDGADFARWWLELLRLYRQELPGHRFIYPGLSPGHDVIGIKQDHIRFVEASREAVAAADGLGVHIYWSNVYPMERALYVLDDYISRFRYKPIWVTEASNNKVGRPYTKGQQYLKFWQELQKRPTVQGVTYFVASASNPIFGEEVWVGRDIGSVVGRR